MRQGFKYRHKNCLDMDMLVVNVNFIGKVYITVEVMYLSQHNPSLLYYPESETIRLYNRNLKDWKEFPNLIAG